MIETSHLSETSVDTLRRRARRRLLGAVVLALCAAIALPLVFEKDPPPLPDEVDIRIPPIDKTPFDPKPIGVKPDSRQSNKAESPASTAQTAAGVPALIAAAPAAAVSAPPAATAPTPTPSKDTPSETVKEPQKDVASGSAATKPETKSVVVDKKPGPREETKTAPPKTANDSVDPDGPKTEPKAGDYAVQLVAVRDASSAKEVLERARSLGYKTAYRERIDVANGVVTRVRTGPYKDKAMAERIKDKLSAEGFEAVVVAIK